jgi:heme-degrading monooxygenase HmoA
VAYVRIAVYQVKPGTVDQIIRKAQGGMLPIFRAQPGFRRYTGIRTGENSVVSLSTWDTRQEADAAIQKAAEWVKQNIAADIVSVSNHVGEVAFSEGAPGEL